MVGRPPHQRILRRLSSTSGVRYETGHGTRTGWIFLALTVGAIIGQVCGSLFVAKLFRRSWKQACVMLSLLLIPPPPKQQQFLGKEALQIVSVNMNHPPPTWPHDRVFYMFIHLQRLESLVCKVSEICFCKFSIQKYKSRFQKLCGCLAVKAISRVGRKPEHSNVYAM